MKGFLTGALVLIGLQVLVTSNQTGRVGGLLSFPATVAAHIFDPNLPAIPDRSTK